MRPYLRDLGTWVRSHAARLLTAPEYRYLRWTLLVGLLVRAVLLPLTSWGYDTEGFVLGSVSMLGGNTPYASQAYFEPPLGAVLQAPLVYLAGPLWHVPLLGFDPSIVPLQIRTLLTFATVPSPAALVAVKLPMVASDLVASLLLFHLVRARWGLPWAGTATALWWLNPVVIWASSVVGQPDTLAAALVLLFLFAAERGAWGLAGWAAGLGAMAKLYPILLLPVGAALIWTAARSEVRSRARSLVGFLLGTVLAILPFALLLQGYGKLLLIRGTSPMYGGLSLAILFNPASPTFGGHLGNAGGPGGAVVLELLQALGILAAVAAPVLLAVWRRRRNPASDFSRNDLTLLASLWSVLGAILLLPAPQPENLVGLLALLAVSLPLLGRYGRWLFAGISAAACLLFLSFLGPLAYFYPLAEQLGPGAVAGIDSEGFAFWHLPTLLGHGMDWWISGMVAGVSAIVLWGILLRTLWPKGSFIRRPPRASPVRDPSAEPAAGAERNPAGA
jgi:hypothetical protein